MCSIRGMRCRRSASSSSCHGHFRPGSPWLGGCYAPGAPVPTRCSCASPTTAAAISISPNGLRNFLNGSVPRSATRAKLERWLADQQHVSRPPNVGQLVRLLNELAGDLSTQQTAMLAGDIAGLLATAYDARRLSPPRWVQDLLRHYRVRRGKTASEVA